MIDSRFATFSSLFPGPFQIDCQKLNPVKTKSVITSDVYPTALDLPNVWHLASQALPYSDEYQIQTNLLRDRP